MRSIILFLFAATTTVTALAQRSTFNDISLNDTDNTTSLSFTTDNNVNVRHYRVEASNDQQEFTVIATIPSKNNSMHPTEYNYDLVGHDYTYYRVAKVAMDGSMPYSEIVTIKKGGPIKPYQNIKAPDQLSAEVENK